jgi:hypothetical protein
MKNKILLLWLFLTYFNGFSQSDSTLTAEDSTKAPNWEKSLVFSTSFSHTLNINAPIGTPRQGMALTFALDLTANYIKETSKLHFLNELHWLFSFGKADAKSRTLSTADQVLTFHDISYAFKRRGDWNINTIISAESPLFTQFEGNFLKDYYQLGRVQAFLNPYTVRVAPGIKYQPGRYLGISLSPYSFELFGLTNQFIADKGDFITKRRLDGHYETSQFKPLGAELNVWWKKNIGKRFAVNYKYKVSYNYFANTIEKGQMGGLFITSYKVFNGFTINHRATLNGTFKTGSAFQPFYNQVVLLSYTLSL